MFDQEFKTVIGGTIFVLLFGLFSNFIISRESQSYKEESSLGSWACTTDVYVCPDGSTVGRTPPYCKFAACESW